MSFRIVLADRDLRLAVGARALSLLGDDAALIALTMRMHDQGGGAGAVAALLIAGFLPLVLLAPLVGRAVDRYDSRTLLVGSSVAQAALCVALACTHSTAAILALVTALGAGQALNGATWQSLLPSIVGVENLPAALGVSQSVNTFAGIAAPALGGALTGLYGAGVPLLLDAATFVAVTGAALLIGVRRHGGPAEGEQAGRGGYTLIRRDPVLVRLFAMLAVFITLGATVNVVDVFLVRDTLHASATWYGAVGASWGVGLLVGSGLGGRLRGQTALARWQLFSACVLSLALAGYALVGTVGLLVPLAVVGGTGNGIVNLTIGALVMTRAPQSARGRVSAAVNGIASAAMIGAYLLGGVLALHITPRTIYLVAGLLGLLGPILFGRALLAAARQAELAANAAAANAAAADAAAPIDTAPFDTAPFDTAPFDTAPFDTADAQAAALASGA